MQGASFGSVDGTPTMWVPLAATNEGRLDATNDGTVVTIWTYHGVASQ